MIPRIIHYCWFGGNPLTDEARRCIKSWKKFCPEYRIMEWNESNFNIDCCEYVKEAYKAKKWAFVSDYARFWILFNFGGLYFDTDVELIAPIDDIITNGAYMGCEKDLELASIEEDLNAVNPGLGMAVEAKNRLIKQLLDSYNMECFIKENGTHNIKTIVTRTTDILKKYGFNPENNERQIVEEFIIYPREYFCPKDYITGEINIKVNTKSIHHYSATWLTPIQKKINTINNKYAIKGNKWKLIARILTIPLIIKDKIETVGIIETIKIIIEKIKS